MHMRMASILMADDHRLQVVDFQDLQRRLHRPDHFRPVQPINLIRPP